MRRLVAAVGVAATFCVASPAPAQSPLSALKDRISTRFFKAGLVHGIVAGGVGRAYHRQARRPAGRPHEGVIEGFDMALRRGTYRGSITTSWFQKKPEIYACAFGARWAVPATGDTAKLYATRFSVPRGRRLKTFLQSCFFGTPKTVRFAAPTPTNN